ncbi:hypothetical protein NQ317_007659 [Molorchus minor]|uniref:RNase H type-1 domain-containing protein n=1 Tax=Molorchus minor TaxID=1323400 RepID=A0ABQ9JQC0_9CUCU|nr:hypothetical protein NQ317_007659 [Molorchus minor]
MRKDHMTPKFTHNRKFGMEITNRKEWSKHNSRNEAEAIIWYTDGSKTQQGTGAGICSETETSIPFHSDNTPLYCRSICNIALCKENIRRAYVNKRINIFSDIQAALKALTNPKVTSRLVWECQEDLENLADHNRVTLLWVLGHPEIQGNEKADELERRGSSTPFIDPKPAQGVSNNTAGGQTREWYTTWYTLKPYNQHTTL